MQEDQTQPQAAPVPATPVVGLVKKFPTTKKAKLAYLGVALLVILAGVGTGWMFSGRPSVGGTATNVTKTNGDGVVTEAGIEDNEAFPDTAEGILLEGGVDGEGTHHLDRSDLGPGKDVYLTSTVIDLQSFVDKKVQIWGQTIAGHEAAWLMDVGRIKVME